MGPLDPRLLRRAGGARFALSVDIALGLLSTVSLLTQAVLFAGIVAGAFDGTTLAAQARALALLAAVVAVRSLLAGAFEATGRRAAARVMSELRMALVERRLRNDPLAAVRSRVDALVSWGWDYFSGNRAPAIIDVPDAARIGWGDDGDGDVKDSSEGADPGEPRA